MSIPDELERLAALRESGALSEEEFQAAKARLLRGGADPAPIGSTQVPAPGRVRQPPSAKRLIAYAVVAALATAGIGVWGFSDVSLSSPEASKRVGAQIKELAADNETRREQASIREQQAAEAFAIYSNCQTEIGPLLKALDQLDSRLDVGLNFQSYSEFVSTLSVHYNRISFRGLDGECLSGAGVAAENAFNSYTRAYNLWNDCIGDFGCSTDSIESELQEHWLKATRAIGKARRELRALQA